MAGGRASGAAATAVLICAVSASAMQVEVVEEATAPDRSRDLVLSWVTDPGMPNRDSLLLLEIANESDRPIPLNKSAGHWLGFSLQIAGGRERRSSPMTGCGGSWASYLVLPPRSRLHWRVRLTRRDSPREAEAEDPVLAKLVARLFVDPTSVIFKAGIQPPSPIPREPPPTQYAGYRARSSSPPLGLQWEWRDSIPDREPLPGQWQVWEDALRTLGDLQDEERRKLAARRAGLHEETPATILSGVEPASEEWKRELGPYSPWSEPDDLAFSLAAHQGLVGAPELQRQLLRWVEIAHPDSTGARRAEVLLEWMAVPGGRETYLTWGGGPVR